ncbi:MAG: DUF2239 family protein [Cyanobacteria bacterium]|nr:DUF2239 family protein [Cyanobacteriota bacterium]
MPPTVAAFDGDSLISEGDIVDVALQLSLLPDAANAPSFLVFEELTGKQIDLDLRGPQEAIIERYKRDATSDAHGSDQPAARTGPGRPKLGVVSREVTMLPRHWDWLNKQPGGASVALRKLVDEARKSQTDRDGSRRARESAYAFMAAMAGNRRGFEEATRALFRADRARFLQETESWPEDVRAFALKLASASFEYNESPANEPSQQTI